MKNIIISLILLCSTSKAMILDELEEKTGSTISNENIESLSIRKTATQSLIEGINKIHGFTLSMPTERGEITFLDEQEPKHRVQSLTLKQVADFLNHKIDALTGETTKNSAALAYDFLCEKFSNNKIILNLAKARLLIDRSYPNGENLDDYAKDLKKSLIRYAEDNKKNPNSASKRLANHAFVWAARLAVRLNYFDEAYDLFNRVAKSYSKSYLLDIVDLLLNYDFYPEGIEDDNQILELAQSLLGQIKVSQEKETKIDTENEQFLKSFERRNKANKKKYDDTRALVNPSYAHDKNNRKRKREFEENLNNKKQRIESHIPNNEVVFMDEIENFANADNDELILQQDEQNNYKTYIYELLLQAKIASNVYDNESAGELLNQAINLSKKSKNRYLLARARLRLAHIRGFTIDNTKNKIDLFLLVLKYAIPNRLYGMAFDAFKGLGNLKYISPNSKKGPQQWFEEAFKSANKLGDPIRIALSYVGFGASDRKNTLSHYQKALDIAEEIKDERLQAKVLIKMSLITRQIDGFIRAIKFAQESNDKRLEARAWFGKSTISGQKEDYQQVFNISSKIGEKSLEAKSLLILGKLNHEKELLIRALKIFECIGDSKFTAKTLIELGGIDHENQQELGTKALELAEGIDHKELMFRALFGLTMSANNKEDAKKYANQALALITHIGDKYLPIQFELHLQLSNLLSEKLHPNEERKIETENHRFEHARAAYDIAQKMGDQNYLARALYYMGVSSPVDYALHLYHQALDLASEGSEIKGKIIKSIELAERYYRH